MGIAASLQDTVRAVNLGRWPSGSVFTFIVFVCSRALGSRATGSCRRSRRGIIAIVFRDPVLKYPLTVFVFFFTFTLVRSCRVTTTVPMLTTQAWPPIYGCMASLLFSCASGREAHSIDHVGKSFASQRGAAGSGLPGTRGYRKRLSAKTGKGLARPNSVSRWQELLSAAPPTADGRTSIRQGAVLAFDIEGLVLMAQRADCVIEMVPRVGEFIGAGEPLFRIFQGGAGIDVCGLRNSIAVGQERTMEQDPALAFRIMVDIASKGLSPAINDPTTAVLAIDQIHHLLRNVGGRDLDDDRIRDASGRVRLVYRTPAWEDFVRLAVTEIRHFGGESIQIARRLRAMLEDLIQTLPSERTALLRQELELLHRSAARFFPEPEDQAQAGISDSQGVGSHCGRATPEQ